MKKIITAVLSIGLMSCSAKPSNEIDALAEEVIKRREGVAITVTPIDPVKK